MKRILLLVAIVALSMTGKGLKAQQNWSYEFGLGGTYNSGNVSNIGFRTNAGLGRNDSIKAVYANIRFVYNEEQKVPTNKGLDGSIKFDYYRNIHWSPFIAAEFVTNHFKGYDFKTAFLGGLKYTFFYKKDVYDYSVSAALVGDYVDFTGDNSMNGMKMRVSARVQARQKIGESTTLYHATFYQPAVNELSDFLFSSVTKVSNKLNEHVYFDVIFDYGYRSVVPEDRHHHDLTTEVAIKIKF